MDQSQSIPQESRERTAERILFLVIDEYQEFPVFIVKRIGHGDDRFSNLARRPIACRHAASPSCYLAYGQLSRHIFMTVI